MATLSIPIDTTSLRIEPWLDPVVDRLGHDPRSSYVERFWLATLGPSTVWLLRHLVERLESDGPGAVDLDVEELAHTLGLVPKKGPPTSLFRAIERSGTFGATRFDGSETLLVRRRLPPLTRRQTLRLPPALREEHHRWLERQGREPEELRLRQRARQLALSLLDLGESFDETERMLHRWRFHPAVAHDAMRWATTKIADRHGSSVTDSTSTTDRKLVDASRGDAELSSNLGGGIAG